MRISVPLAALAVALSGVAPLVHTAAGESQSLALQVSEESLAAAGLSFYVSPSGSDSNPGTSSRPFRSLARAQDVVRTRTRHMTANITVYLERGTYRLSEPLQLDARDSGMNGHTVVWRGAPGGTAEVSGALRISGWTLADPAKNIWSTDVPPGVRTRQLYVNGMRARMASGPPPRGLKRTTTGYSTSSPMMAHWRNPTNIEFVYTSQLGLIAEPICRVASITETTITMAQPCWDNSAHRLRNLVGWGTLRRPARVENAYELLDEPGEFYLDESSHKLSYIPRPGQNMQSADVELPVLQTLVRGVGKPSAPVHNLSFANLQFSYATWLQPSTPDGFSEVQSNYTITGAQGYRTEGLCHTLKHGKGTCPYGAWTKEPGNVEFSYDKTLSFVDDRFVHLGAAGLNLDNGSQHVTVLGSVFTDISGNGLEIGSVNLPEATGRNQTRYITVADNHFYGLSVEYHSGVAILVGYVANSTIAHNQLDHLSYSGISMGWGGWPDKIGQPAVANDSHDNVIAYNLIYDFMQYVVDGGGIYTQGVTGPSLPHGQKVIGNVVHDQLAWSYALHSDNGASYITYARNVLYANNYDYCCNHYDFKRNDGGWDPQVIRDNYWQQGDPNSSTRRVLQTRNTIIVGPRQVPASILSRVGITARYHSILRWRPPGRLVPSPPSRVTALYAFRGRAYITWHPSFAEGNGPIQAYIVSACPAGSAVYVPTCRRPGAIRSIAVPATTYKRLGYAVVRGLQTGGRYIFTVTARSRAGSSTSSIPSLVVTISPRAPASPDSPRNIRVRPAHGAVSLLWYAPKSSRCAGPWFSQVCRRPILAFIVSSSTGQKYSVTGLSQLIVSNASGRTVRVIGGLQAHRSYRFSIAAVTPGGVGPAATSDRVTPW